MTEAAQGGSQGRNGWPLCSGSCRHCNRRRRHLAGRPWPPPGSGWPPWPLGTAGISSWRARNSGTGGCPNGPAGPTCVPPPPGALLQCPGLLQQGLLDQHPPSLPAFGRDALGPQWTCHKFGPVELKGPQAADPPLQGKCVLSSPPPRAPAAHPARRKPFIPISPRKTPPQ